MGKSYCAMPECHNFAGKLGRFGKVVTLHRLPKNKPLKAAWVRKISRKFWKPTAYTRVCSDHFEDGVGPDYCSRNKTPTEHLAQNATQAVKGNGKSRRALFKHTESSQMDEHMMEAESSVPVMPDAVGSPMYSNLTDFHGYAKCSGESEESEETAVANSIGAQVRPDTSDAASSADKPDTTIEDIQHSDKKVLLYTGLPSYTAFMALFITLIEFGADKICTAEPNKSKTVTERKRKLRQIDEFLMVLMRLRLGLLVNHLEDIFKISGSSISKIFNSWLLFMFKYFQSLVFLPTLDILQLHVPACFKNFSDTRIILDCTEFFIQTPSSLENQSVTYSSYKSHNTFKVLIGVNMTGAVVFVSKLWGGSVSDLQITVDSNLLSMLNNGDAVMVDKGFVHLKPHLNKIGVKLYCPPFKTKHQFSKEEVELTRHIASARIHVERKMEQIKNFRILQGVLPIALSNVASELVFVCSALTNLLPPLVK